MRQSIDIRYDVKSVYFVVKTLVQKKNVEKLCTKENVRSAEKYIKRNTRIKMRNVLSHINVKAKKLSLSGNCLCVKN